MKKLLLLILSLIGLTQCREVSRQEEKKSPADSAVTAEHNPEEAKTLAMTVQSKLGNTLMEKIQQGGIPEAIAFCNVKALPITDSISKQYGVQIQRITNRPRNAANRANPQESVLMQRLQDSMMSGVEYANLLTSESAEGTYYFPIIAADLCLKCHGTPGKEVTPEDYGTISKYYPDDKAIGYNTGELRGLWKVSYKSN